MPGQEVAVVVVVVAAVVAVAVVGAGVVLLPSPASSSQKHLQGKWLLTILDDHKPDLDAATLERELERQDDGVVSGLLLPACPCPFS